VRFKDRYGIQRDAWGTVCDDSFNDHAADLSCQYLGYKYAEAWGSDPDNFEYVPQDVLEEEGNNYPIAVDELQCGNMKSQITECEANVMTEHDCHISESIWLRCSEEPYWTDWKMDFVRLYKLNDEGAYPPYFVGKEGLVLTSYTRRQGQVKEQGMLGTICDNSFDSHEANLTCQAMGYGYAVNWGSGEDQNSKYMPESFMTGNNLGAVIDEVQCSDRDTNITHCEIRFAGDYDCGYSKYLWMKCDGEWDGGEEEEEEEEGEEEEEKEDDDEDEDDDDEQGLYLDFGGAKVTLNVNKLLRKWIF